MPIRSASSTSSSWRRNISVCVEFSRGVVVDQIASRISPSPVQATACRARQPAGFIVPSAAGFVNHPLVLLVGADIQAATTLSGSQRLVGEGDPDVEVWT